MRRRVVITGVGVVSPLGLDAPSTWAGLVAGKSGIGPITKFDVSAFSCRIGGEVRGFVPENYIDRKEVKKMDTFIHFAIAASREAMSDSGLTIDENNDDRVGVYIGSGIGGMPLFEETHKLYLEKGPRKISPFCSSIVRPESVMASRDAAIAKWMKVSIFLTSFFSM